MKDEIDEILQYAVNHAYEVMDSKSFEDPFTKAKQAILALKKKWETEAYKKGYIQAGIDNLTNGDK